jgi:hypothetical protein
MSQRPLGVFLAAAIGIVTLGVAPAKANHVQSATATANCSGYSLTVTTNDLTPNTTYTIDYTFSVQCGSNAAVPYMGSITFTTGAGEFQSTNTATGTFALGTNSTNSGNCVVTGTATLTSSGSTLDINIGGTTSGFTVTCPSTSPVCAISPSGTAIGGNGVSWNKFNTVGTTDVVWINAHIGTPKGVSTTGITTVNFTGVTFVLNSQTYNLPDGELVFDPSAPATPSTAFFPFNGPYGQWVTTLNPNNLSDEIFFDGNGVPVDSNISGGGSATFNYSTLSSDNNLAFSWQWSAAVYTNWPGNSAAMILAYHHSLHAGTPLNTTVQKSLIQGPRGGGGSNFTGSWSGTGQGSCPGAN